MADYELFCPDQASMDAALVFMNLKNRPTGRSGATYFGVDAYGTKYLLNTATPPVAVAQAGMYCNIRWVGPSALPALPSGTTCTIKLQTKPADYRDWA